jgi:hypothetical protein
MAKDPAVLWYWNDWQSGTVTLSRHLKGCYMDLLHAQFNNGRLSLAQIKTVLGVDFAQAWPALQAKFKKDGNDNYYNERAEFEKIKRQTYSESRRKNGVRPHMPKHMHTHKDNVNENETAIVVKDGGLGEELPGPVKGLFTDLIDKQIELTDLQIGKTIEFVRIMSKKMLTVQEVKDYWDAYKINQFYKHEWYSGFEAVVSHFRNSLKIEKQKNGTHQQTPGKRPGRKSEGAEQLLASLKGDLAAGAEDHSG